MISADGKPIDWLASGEAEVVQNVRMVLSVREGEQPLLRSFGLSWDQIDGRIPLASAHLRAEVVRKVQRSEPRARVRRVHIEAGDVGEGELKPVVEIEVNL